MLFDLTPYVGDNWLNPNQIFLRVIITIFTNEIYEQLLMVKNLIFDEKK